MNLYSRRAAEKFENRRGNKMNTFSAKNCESLVSAAALKIVKCKKLDFISISRFPVCGTVRHPARGRTFCLFPIEKIIPAVRRQ